MLTELDKRRAGQEWDVLASIATRYNSAPLFRQAIIYILSCDRGTFIERGGFAYVDAKTAEAVATLESAKAHLFPEVQS